ncbi:MAG: autotransporter-associated beta strand repeat-containing protein [bacterium]
MNTRFAFLLIRWDAFRTTTVKCIPVMVIGITVALTGFSVDRTWNGGGTSVNWNEDANWGGTKPASGDKVLFGGSAKLANTNDFIGYNIGGITFNSGAGTFTLGGNAITNTSHIINNSAALQTLNMGITLSAETWISGVSGPLNFGGQMNLNGQMVRVGYSSGAYKNIAFPGGVVGTTAGLLFYRGTNIVLNSTNTITITGYGFDIINSDCPVHVDLGASSSINAGSYPTYIRGGAGGPGTLSMSGGTYTTTDRISLGLTANQSGVLNIGGSAAVTVKYMFVCGQGTGTVNHTGGTLAVTDTSATYGFRMNDAVTSHGFGSYNLSGGELQGNTWYAPTDGTNGVFNFSGGTIRPYNINNSSFTIPLTLTGSNSVISSTDGGSIARTFIMSAPIGEAGGARDLTFAGTGTISLATNNVHSGVTTLAGGTLAIAHPMALKNSALNYTNGTVTFATGITSAQFGGLKGTGNLSLVNASNVGVALTVSNSATMTYGGVLSDNSKTGSLVKAGSGTLILTNTSTYIGGTTINNGILQLGDGVNNGAVNLSNLTNNSPIDGGLTFACPAGVTLANTLAGIGSIRIQSGSLTLGSSTNIHQFNNLPNNAAGIRTDIYAAGTGFKVNAGKTIIVTQLGIFDSGGNGLANAHNVYLYDNATGKNIATGNVASGTAAAYANGYRFVSLSTPMPLSAGAAALTNTVWGDATGNGDAWAYDPVTYDNGANGEVTYLTGRAGTTTNVYPGGYSGFTYTFATFKFYNPNADISLGALTTNSPVQIGPTGILNLSAGNQQVASLSDYGGGGVVTRSVAGAAALTLGANNGSSTFNGVIQDGNGILSVVKTGAGTQVLGGTNTYTGTTTVLNGTLSLTQPQCLSSNTAVIVSGDAKIDLSFTGINIVKSLTVNGELKVRNSLYSRRNLPAVFSGDGYLYVTDGARPKGTMIQVF